MRRRIARRLAGHDEQHANIVGDGPLERLIQYLMRTRQRMTVQIDAAFGLHGAAPQSPVPAAVEGFSQSRRSSGGWSPWLLGLGGTA